MRGPIASEQTDFDVAVYIQRQGRRHAVNAHTMCTRTAVVHACNTYVVQMATLSLRLSEKNGRSALLTAHNANAKKKNEKI